MSARSAAYAECRRSSSWLMPGRSRTSASIAWVTAIGANAYSPNTESERVKSTRLRLRNRQSEFGVTSGPPTPGSNWHLVKPGEHQSDRVSASYVATPTADTLAIQGERLEITPQGAGFKAAGRH